MIQIGQFYPFLPSHEPHSTLSRKPPSVTPLAPQQPGGPGPGPGDLPPDPPAPPEPRRGGWHPVQPRGGGFTRRLRKKSGPPRPGPVAEVPPPMAPPPERVQTTGSWATWQGRNTPDLTC